MTNFSKKYLEQPNYGTFAPIWMVKHHKNDMFPAIFLLEEEANNYIKKNDLKRIVTVCSIPRYSALHQILKSVVIPEGDTVKQYVNIL